MSTKGFEVGKRVRMRGDSRKGKIYQIDRTSFNEICVQWDKGHTTWVRMECLKLLKPKAKPEPRKVARRWFVELEHNGDVRWGRDHAFVCKAGGEIVQVNEILPGQVLVSREELEQVLDDALVKKGSSSASFMPYIFKRLGFSEKGGGGK